MTMNSVNCERLRIKHVARRFFIFLIPFLVVVITFTTTESAFASANKCLNDYKKFLVWHKKSGNVHYAVATSAGRALTVGDTACGISAANTTQTSVEAAALKICSNQNKIHHNSATCLVIESK